MNRMNIFQKLYHKDLEKAYDNFAGIIFDNVIGDVDDLQDYFSKINETLDKNTPILISYHNHNWEPVLTLASKIGLRKSVGLQNWVDTKDLENILILSGFKILNTVKRFFGLTFVTTAISGQRQKSLGLNKYSVSIIVPARNEAGNIKNIIPSIPNFGKSQEIIFIEGNSTDKTWDEIASLPSNYSSKVRVVKLRQKGKGKADAAWQGLKQAKGDILMIYDADRTVPASDLPKFYNALAAGVGDFANGNRLLYPMETGAMQFLNKLGNQLFSYLFTWILGQRFKDTLCGTKVFWRRDFKKFRRSRTDPFGDFDLIFGAIRNNLKVVEIPVRYKERVYGKTNINRFYHGLLLIKMTVLAFLEFKT